MKLSVQLVTWNGERHLKPLFESLQNQEFKDFELLILDNGSVDNSRSIITRENNSFQVFRTFLENENIGFAPAHNKLFAHSDSEYVLLLNQDIVLEKNVVDKMVKFLDQHQNFSSVSVRLMRIENSAKTDVIDSLGLKVVRSRKIADSNSGEKWSPMEGEGYKNVFGVTGALAMYRRSSIKKIGNKLFDDKYFSYQEDFDLAWKLRLAGFDSAVLPDVVAYHERSGRESKEKNVVSSAVNKLNQSTIVKFHSYKNHLMTIYKNEQWQNFAIDFPWILWYEVRKLIFFLLFSKGVLRGLALIWKERKNLASERNFVQINSVVSWKEIRKWWS